MQSHGERHAHLLAIVANAAGAHRVWVETSDSKLIPEDELYQRFQEISDQARVIYAPQASPLEQLILRFSPHWQAFVSQQQTTSDPTLLPSPDLWQVWEHLESVFFQSKTPKLKRVETLQELLDQKVGREQICKILGFVDDTGAVDLQKLHEEIAQPGRHIDKNWVAPVNRLIASQIKQMEVEAETLSRRRNAKIAAATTPARESIESLVVNGVSAVQISKLKKISIDAVYDYCREHNLPEPPYDYTGVMQSPGAHDPAISPERQSAMDNLGKDHSPQFAPTRHPMAEDDELPQGDSIEGDDPESPNGVDLSDLPPEEANQVQEASQYYAAGMDVAGIASAMSLHGNKVRGLLRKAGYDLAAV